MARHRSTVSRRPRVRTDGALPVDLPRHGPRSSGGVEPAPPGRRHLRRVRVLRISPGRGGAPSAGCRGKRQDASAPDARARPAAHATSPLLGDDGQQPRRPDLSGPRQGCRSRPPQPTPDRGPDLRAPPRRLRLLGRRSGRLVTQGGRLRHQPVHGRPDRRGGAEGGLPEPRATQGLRSPLGPRVAIRIGGVSRAARRPRSDGFNEPIRQPPTTTPRPGAS